METWVVTRLSAEDRAEIKKDLIGQLDFARKNQKILESASKKGNKADSTYIKKQMKKSVLKEKLAYTILANFDKLFPLEDEKKSARV